MRDARRQTEKQSRPRQSPRLGFDIRSKVKRVGRITPRHEGQLAGRVVQQDIGELVATEDLLRRVAGGGVARGELVGVDVQEHAVGVADEIHKEEDGWVCVGWLHLRMGFEGTVLFEVRTGVCSWVGGNCHGL